MTHLRKKGVGTSIRGVARAAGRFDLHFRLIVGLMPIVILLAHVPRSSAQTNSTGVLQTQQHDPVFIHHYVEVNNVRLHYVVLGQGDPVLLLPGWRENWFAWRTVMVELAASGRKVFALIQEALAIARSRHLGTIWQLPRRMFMGLSLRPV